VTAGFAARAGGKQGGVESGVERTPLRLGARTCTIVMRKEFQKKLGVIIKKVFQNRLRGEDFTGILWEAAANCRPKEGPEKGGTHNSPVKGSSDRIRKLEQRAST